MRTDTWRELIRPAAPVAGADFTHRIPSRAFERLLSLTTTLTTDDTTGNRNVVLDILDGDGTVWARYGTPGNIAPSSSAIKQWSILGTTINSGGGSGTQSAIPDQVLPAGYSWKIAILNGGTGDTLTAIAAWIEFYPTGRLGYPGGARADDPEYVT